MRGDWIDPRKSQEPFELWATTWRETLGGLKPKTRESYESILQRHLLPAFGPVPDPRLDYPRVLAFVADLQRWGLGAGTVSNIRDVLRLVLALAVRSGALKVQPVRGVAVARTRRSEMVFLDADQVMTLATEVSRPPPRYRTEERRRDGYPEYGLLVRFAAFTGLRAGELVALRCDDLDLLHRRVEVDASASEAHGQLEIVATKSYERRTVPIPRSLITELAEHTAANADGLVWAARRVGRCGTRTGSSGTSSRRSPAPALPERTRFHDLRHTYAALLIAQGAHHRAIMERMGHSTITVTLDTYGHLLPKIDAALDEALDSTYRGAATRLAAPVRMLRPTGGATPSSVAVVAEPN